MLKRIKKINSIVSHDGTNPYRDEFAPIYIVQSDERKLGIVDEKDNLITNIAFDCIYPVGYGIWILQKHGKFGALVLEEVNNELAIVRNVSCRYDYVEKVDGAPALIFRNFRSNSYDTRELYIARTGELISCSCRWIEAGGVSTNYCLITKKDRTYLYDTKRHVEFDIKAGFVEWTFVINNHCIYLIFLEDVNDKSIIYRIDCMNNNCIESDVFDGVPRIVETYIAEDSDPILSFIVKRGSKYLFLDDELCEISKTFDYVGLVVNGLGFRANNVSETELARAYFED